tara:strand:- start:122 stop:322 length:201 start_codon:yes stop_codon:yes gene_type:complete
MDNRYADAFRYFDGGVNTPCVLTETSNVFSYSTAANSPNTFTIINPDISNFTRIGLPLIKVNGNNR